jgi:hypothetical protein
MYALPYATTWPELSAQLLNLYDERASPIPWLPPMWIDYVHSLHGAEGQVLVPAPANVTPGIPWLDTPEKKAWWNDFAARATAIVTRYAAKQADAGRGELAKLYADSAFWNRAYQIAYVLATPVRGAQAVYNNPLTSAAIVGAVVIAAMLLRRK